VLEVEPIGIGAGTVIGGLIQTTCTTVPDQGCTGPSTRVPIGKGEFPAVGMLDDAAPALAVLEAATAAGAWTRVTCTEIQTPGEPLLDEAMDLRVWMRLWNELRVSVDMAG
jgi:hypothetical protein